MAWSAENYIRSVRKFVRIRGICTILCKFHTAKIETSITHYIRQFLTSFRNVECI